MAILNTAGLLLVLVGTILIAFDAANYTNLVNRSLDVLEIWMRSAGQRDEFRLVGMDEHRDRYMKASRMRIIIAFVLIIIGTGCQVISSFG
jgi:uncharacterized membrane protein